MRKPEGAAQPGVVSPVLVASRAWIRRRGKKPHRSAARLEPNWVRRLLESSVVTAFGSKRQKAEVSPQAHESSVAISGMQRGASAARFRPVDSSTLSEWKRALYLLSSPSGSDFSQSFNKPLASSDSAPTQREVLRSFIACPVPKRWAHTRVPRSGLRPTKRLFGARGGPQARQSALRATKSPR